MRGALSGGATLTDASGLAHAPRGRSLWSDARRRFLRNGAAVAGMAVLALIGLGAFIAPLVAPWSLEEIDWSGLGNVAEVGRPSLATGHWFGTDSLGRDLFARTVQGTQISLMVGIVGARIAIVVGRLHAAVAAISAAGSRAR